MAFFNPQQTDDDPHATQKRHLDWGRANEIVPAFVDAKSLLTLRADVEGKRKQSLVDSVVVRHVLHLQFEYERSRKDRPHF